jgi:hypothetical protein
MTAPILQLPDFDKAFIIECDASGSEFGAVLHQGDGTITFFSWATAAHHAKLPAYERELIGLGKAVRHWRPYVWGRSFIIHTDHFSLKYILDQWLTTIPQHTWVSKLFGYDFIVEYRQGKLNTVADALSQRTEDMAVHSLLSPTFALYNQLCQECESLLQALQLRSQIQDATAPPGWSKVDGLLIFQGRILLPDESSLWQAVLEMAHTMGHKGGEKTLHRFRSTFYSPQARCRVHEFAQSCTVCQQDKTEHLHPGALLRPLPIPHQVWSDIAMNFIDGFPKVGGKSVILTVVDRFSQYAHFIQLSHPYSASSVVKAFFDSIVHLHGMPCSIVIEIPYLLATFGQSCFSLQVSSC